jgi:hypothetical protein
MLHALGAIADALFFSNRLVRWRLAVPEHDRLHLCRCGIERPSRASQLPARNYFALPPARLIGRLIPDLPNFRLGSKWTSEFR